MANTQSIKNKEQRLFNKIFRNSLDIIGVMETWLKDTQCDDAWVSASDINKPPYQFQPLNRKEKHGGRIALVSKSTYQTNLVKAIHCRSFEAGTWSVHTGKKTLTVNVVSHGTKR